MKKLQKRLLMFIVFLGFLSVINLLVSRPLNEQVIPNNFVSEVIGPASYSGEQPCPDGSCQNCTGNNKDCPDCIENCPDCKKNNKTSAKTKKDNVVIGEEVINKNDNSTPASAPVYTQADDSTNSQQFYLTFSIISAGLVFALTLTIAIKISKS